MAQQDIKQLIPRARRVLGEATDGIADDDVKAAIADAMAEIVFFTGGVFGHKLIATHRDTAYDAPDQWAVDPELTLAEETVVLAQVALNYFFASLQELKTSETIRDEGAEWSYTISASALGERIKYLMSLRDDALAQVQASAPPLDAWVSILHARDHRTARLVEPYYHGLLG